MADTGYEVHAHNTLWNIAKTYRINKSAPKAIPKSVPKLVEQSQIYTNLREAHQILRVPHAITKSLPRPHASNHRVARRLKSGLYRVHPGDTLWGIALANHVSVAQLMNTNHLYSSVIYPGQKLVVDKKTRVFLPYMTTLRFAKGGPPAQFIPVYMAAGQKYGVSWTVLAAIHRVETNFSTEGLMSSEGAEGPMQFMPATFQYYGVTAPGQLGQPNINNVEDAIYTCARMLAANGFSQNPGGALYCYNHSTFYVQQVLSYARMYQELTPVS